MRREMDTFGVRITSCGKQEELGLKSSIHAINVSVVTPTVKRGKKVLISPKVSSDSFNGDGF